MAARTGFQFLVPAMFLLIAAVIVPMTQTSGMNIPPLLAHGTLWLGIVFAALIGIENLFLRDGEDGTLSLIAISDCPLWLYALGKIAAHWATHILPMLCVFPVAAMMLNIPVEIWQNYLIMVALASVWIIWLGGTLAAILVALPQSGMLLPFIALPMIIPAVIFGAGGQFYWLAALCLAAFPLAPIAIAAILRGAQENM